MDFRLSATFGLIFWFIVVFVTDLQSQPTQMLLMQAGAAEPLRVWSGEYWRLVSAVFLHAHVIHLGLSVFVLLQIGRWLEPLIGSFRFLLVFLMSAVVGLSISLLVNGQMVVGASAGLFGLMGSFLALLWKNKAESDNKKLLRGLLFWIGLNLVLGVVVNRWPGAQGGIDNVSHVAGFLFGILFTISFLDELSEKKLSSSGKLVSNLCFGASAISFFMAVSLGCRPVMRADYNLFRAQSEFLSHDLPEAKRYAYKALEFDTNRSKANTLLARILVAQGKSAEGKALFAKTEFSWIDAMGFFTAQFELDQALFMDEVSNRTICEKLTQGKRGASDFLVLNNCAWLVLMSVNKSVQDRELGLKWARAAALVAPKNELSVLHTLAEAYAHNNDQLEAKAILEKAVLSANGAQRRFLMSEALRMGTLAKQKAAL